MTNNYNGYLDFYNRGPYASYLVEHQLLGTADIKLIHAAQPEGEFPDPAMPEYFLYVALRGASELSFDWGCGRWAERWCADDVSLAPPNVATSIHVSEPHEFLALSLPASFVNDAIAELTGLPRSDLGVLHTMAFRDPSVVALMRRLRRGTERNALSELSQDCLLLALVQMLIRRLEPRELPEHELDDDRFRRVAACVAEHPGQRFRLAQMAAEAGLSPMHFARQFRRRTGSSPHQYVLRQRLIRLRGMLTTTSHPLVELAYELGFSSQAHMTAAFSSATGMSPARYRREAARRIG